jgi:xylulokinase
MFIVEVARAFRPEATLRSTQGVFEGTVTYAAGLSTSGGLTVRLRDIVGRDFADLIDEAAATPAGADGLVVLPYVGVARSPIFDPQARGAILGLTLAHGRGHLYRALLEGSAYDVRHDLEVMAAAGAAAERLTAVGGGTKSGLWTRVVSDVTGLPQTIPAVTVGASYGDALMAGRGAGLVALDARWNAPADLLAPDPGVAATYAQLYGVYGDLYPATLDAAHALAHIQQSAAAEAR